MKYIEQEVVMKGSFDLAGTLTLPEATGKFPVVIMIHGSGEVDRDENAKQLPINAFKELSELAVSLGFATLRYDKRGIGKSGGDYYETGFFDLIDDAIAAVQFAKEYPNIDGNQVILLSHSEGCLVAPAVYQRVPVQGIILLSGSAEPLSETTAWQRAQLAEDIRNTRGFSGWLLRLLKVDQKLQKMNDDLTEKITSTNEAVIRYKGKKVNAKWNREHGQFDVRDSLKEVFCPVLAITGTKDVQVKPEQVKMICDLVQGECQYELIPEMTHILRKTEAENKIGTILKEYKKQVQKPIDQELKEKIGAWLKNWREKNRHD